MGSRQRSIPKPGENGTNGPHQEKDKILERTCGDLTREADRTRDAGVKRTRVDGSRKPS
jgi:hypothetical protein